MSPVIILDKQGRFVAAVGSPGGSSILSCNLRTLVGAPDWNLTMQPAIRGEDSGVQGIIVREGVARGC